MTIPQFRKLVWSHAKEHGRHMLPWRKRTATSYRILVSEVMLQQTQVDRVVPFYKVFLRRFPTIRSLAGAPLGDVLRVWQGLGYNRRAKMLHDAAKAVVREYGGRLPREVNELERLPGVGPYTARAIAAFAYNKNFVFVETNLRTAVIHHFYPNRKKVTDEEVIEVLFKALPKGRAREWYAALMDYGASLKRRGVRTSTQSSRYLKQKSFKGSDREARGTILKALVKEPRTARSLYVLLGRERKDQIKSSLAALVDEGLVMRIGNRYSV